MSSEFYPCFHMLSLFCGSRKNAVLTSISPGSPTPPPSSALRRLRMYDDDTVTWISFFIASTPDTLQQFFPSIGLCT